MSISDARFGFVAKLLGDLTALVPADRHEYAAVLTETVGRQIDHVVDAARVAGFADGVRAAQAAMQPDAESERLRRAGEAAVDGMLDAFAQMRGVTNH